ncbi:MAG: class I SAM-dependent methyltransferase, partial [Acidobacteria bacterium]|nr:class I SAM-dependent methyltransferase [Acidobacteriota bacterium]
EDLWQVLPALASKGAADESSQSERRFLEANLRYPEQSLDAVLVWDLFEYLPEALLEPTRTRLHTILKPGGLLLTVFRNRYEPSVTNRYRLVTRRTFTLMPTESGLRPRRVLQNRAILNLFAGFSSSRRFIGRDNLREVLLVK